MRRLIAHVDADAFFASCEEALHPEWRGRPLVTGLERRIVAAANYPAKAMGVTRGVPLNEVRRLVPDCIIVPSDYETYSLFSLRLFAILRRFTPDVEEYSIDEAFLDLTGLARLHRAGYREIIARIQKAVRTELGIGVSIGLSLSKSLAKIASRREKPDGLVTVPRRAIADFLRDLPAGEICGIGERSAELLAKHGVRTAGEFARLDEEPVRRLLGKNGLELHAELNGLAVRPVLAGTQPPRSSISKSKTFRPPSSDPDKIRAEALRNLESACIKARRHNLAADRLTLLLVERDYRTHTDEARLAKPTNLPLEMLEAFDRLFAALHRPGRLHRATGVVLSGLTPFESIQYSLFDDLDRNERDRRLFATVDRLAKRFGKHTVSLGRSGLILRPQRAPETDLPFRKKNLLPGETRRKRLAIPIWNLKV
jgi:DNA polymerase-4/DNA polymerase V